MKNLLVFSKHIFAASGGAERSILRELELVEKDYNVIVVGNAPKDFGQNLFSHFHCIPLTLENSILARSPYIEYFFARKKTTNMILKIINQYDVDEVWCQNLWAPCVSHVDNLTVFLRDESSVGRRPFYFRGMMRPLGLLYRLVELPFWFVYRRDLRRLYNRSSRIFANSHWMANIFFESYGREVQIKLPDINPNELKELYLSGIKKSDSVVMIGGDVAKGVDIFIKLARCFPRIPFKIYSRTEVALSVPSNLEVMPWTKDRSEPFRNARVIVVPSRWHEAFGRVAAEAVALDIPVIVSRKGGLPEAVGYKDDSIASTFGQFCSLLKQRLS